MQRLSLFKWKLFLLNNMISVQDGGHQSPRSKMFDTESSIKTSHSSPSTIKGKYFINHGERIMRKFCPWW